MYKIPNLPNDDNESDRIQLELMQELVALKFKLKDFLDKNDNCNTTAARLKIGALKSKIRELSNKYSI